MSLRSRIRQALEALCANVTEMAPLAKMTNMTVGRWRRNGAHLATLPRIITSADCSWSGTFAVAGHGPHASVEVAVSSCSTRSNDFFSSYGRVAIQVTGKNVVEARAPTVSHRLPSTTAVHTMKR